MDSADSRAAPAVSRIFRNAGTLVGGKGVAGLLSLAYLAIAARALGPEGLGMLVLAHAYAMTVAGIARFQSWQAVIRFGAPAAASGDSGRLRALLRYTVRLDLFSAALAVAIGLAFAPLAARLFGWSGEALRLVYVYALAAPFLMAATPTGVLRLFDRFRILGAQLAILPAVRLIGAAILWRLGGGVEAFLLVWIVSAFANGLSLWALGWRELKRRDLAPSIFGRGGRRADPRWLPFMLKTNASSTLELANDSVPVLIVGSVLGAAPASFLQLAINATNLIAHPTNMLNQAAYPELARTAAARQRAPALKLAARSAAYALAIAAPVILLVILFRAEIALLLGGPEFAAAAAVIALMAAYQLLRITAVILESAVLALGRAGAALAAQGAGALALIVAMAAMLPSVGAIAAPLALGLGRLSMISVLCLSAARPLSPQGSS